MVSRETIDRIRNRTDILDVIGEHVKLTRKGRSHTGLCPFHKEKTPSFHVNDERGRYHCFGCNADGDAIKFLQEIEGLTFMEAVRQLAERAHVEIEETRSEDERRQASEAKRRTEELYAVNEEAARFFEEMLRRHPVADLARTELSRRQLVAAAPDDAVASALSAFRVGYAPYAWDGLAQHLQRSGHSPLSGEKVGLIAPQRSGNGYYDRFRHRLVFAIHDPRGKVVGFSGRALPEPEPEQLRAHGLTSISSQNADPPAKYLNSPESQIYRKRELVFGLHQARSAIRAAGEAVLVEGNFDVLSLHARGMCNVVAPLGTAFTVEQARQIERHARRLVLLFDGDAAGRRASAAAREPCRERGLEARVATLPQGTDPDDLARQRGIAAVEQCVNASKSLLEYLIDSALDGSFANEGALERAARLDAVAKLLASEDDPVVRAMAEGYADRIAEGLGVADVRTFRALATSVRRSLSDQPGSAARAGRPQPPERARSRARLEDIQHEVFGAVLDFPALLDDEQVCEALSSLHGPLAVSIAAVRHSRDPAGNADSCISAEQLLAQLAAPIHSFAAARLTAPKHEHLRHARTELLENLKKLKRLEQSRQKSELLDALERSRSAGDFEQQMKLLSEQSRRSRNRHGL